MDEFDEKDSNDTSTMSDEIKDYQGDNPSEDLNAQIRDELESTDELDEDSETAEHNKAEDLLDQQGYDDSYAEDVEKTDIYGNSLQDISDEELKRKYEDVRIHHTALGREYAKYGEQIGQISRDKPYYSDKEWNDYMDEKIKAQDEVSTRRRQIESEMLAIEKELDRRKK